MNLSELWLPVVISSGALLMLLVSAGLFGFWLRGRLEKLKKRPVRVISSARRP